LVRLSALITKHKLISDDSRAQVFDIMNQTKNRRLLPSGLGQGASIAHKTGTLGVLLGDIGIIELPNGKVYLAGVFVRRPFNDLRAFRFIQEVSQLTYNYFNAYPLSQGF
jgi:beta-lactamase class A